MIEAIRNDWRAKADSNAAQSDPDDGGDPVRKRTRKLGAKRKLSDPAESGGRVSCIAAPRIIERNIAQMNWVRRLGRVLLVAAVAAALAAAARRMVLRRKRELARAPVYGERPVPVRVAEAVMRNVPVRLSYIAIVEPVHRANVSARLTATIEEVLFDEGDAVRSGAPLVTLDGRDIREGIAAVEGQIAQAQADLAGNEASVASLKRSVAFWDREAARDRRLADRGSIPVSQAEGTAEKANEFRGRYEATRKRSDAIRHLVRSLQSKKSEQETKLGYCTVRSPYDGIVTHRLVDPGDLAVPGRPLMVVEDRSRLKLAFDVPQDDVPSLRTGLSVEFRVGEAVRRTKITLVYPSLDAARMTRVEALLGEESGAGLVCGAYVPLVVELRTLMRVTVVPASSVVAGPAHAPFAFVVRGDRLETRSLTVLASCGKGRAVRGIAPGERVVTSGFLGWVRLSSGLRVEVTQ
ncbi:MAG: efflux RND transporter periplasmic adaptor subunit [Kiritimatiellaeota bacterium]|nr:efflux RND transporter periplasmic adaptor subunit [Kiritimatiellota bacterium]